MENMSERTFGLIGYPLGHSFSQKYFTEKFHEQKIDAAYLNFEIATIDQFYEVLKKYPNLVGTNVTIPYKQAVIPYLTKLDDTAKEIGAVNVVKIIRDSNGEITSMIGYNSDCIGFIDSIKPLLKPWHKKALILGTGGASKAVAYGLRQLGINSKFVSRTAQNDRYTYPDLSCQPHILKEYNVIVNTTPIGMYPNVDNRPDIPYDQLTDMHLCYDVVYNPLITKFMQCSAEYGATVKNGLDMLIGQAEAAWRIWNS